MKPANRPSAGAPIRRVLLAALMVAEPGVSAALSADAIRLENACVRLEVDPSVGGALRSLVFKQAASFPYIANRGAGVAGSGQLFAPVVRIGDKLAGLSEITVTSRDSLELAISGSLASLAPGLKFERRIRLAEEGTSLSIRDVYRNDSGRDLILRVGSSSRQRTEKWRLADRSWIGDEARCRELPVPRSGARSVEREADGSGLFWRQIEQYGTGFLYRILTPKLGGEMKASVLADKGHPVEVTWQSGELTVPAQGSLTVDSEVSLDEGGGAPDEGNAGDIVLARSDFAAAGRSGQPISGFATVVSPIGRTVHVIVAADRLLAQADLTLLPGKVALLPVAFVPAAGGDLAIRVTITAEGRRLGSATAHALIDGDPSSKVWRAYTAKMPEEYYHGTWREIGEQLAQNHGRLTGRSVMELIPAKPGSPDNDLSFYAQHFPYYTDLLAGAAAATRARPGSLQLTERPSGDGAACMDVAFYGPDGPINAYSKERDGPDFRSLGYVKVIPARGYPFHIYMHFGINSEGLSTSGASLNEDRGTDVAAAKALADWKNSGKHTLPPRVGMWMLLSMCRNVDEALGMIQNPEAPMEFTIKQGTNMLLLDRAGNAARVEGVGLQQRIFRRRPEDKGFCFAGNYPEPAPGESPRVASWGIAANTMLRTRFLEDFAGGRQGHLGFADVVAIMQTHEAGGMCQHGNDNPGPIYTCCSFIAVTRTSELWLAEGPPCQVQYVRHTLGAGGHY